MDIMSFQTMLIIWLVLTIAAAIGGAVSHIMDRGARNLSGVCYRAAR